MKRTLVAIQIGIAVILVIKVLSLGGILNKRNTSIESLLSAKKAMAASMEKNYYTPPLRDITEDGLQTERTLIKALELKKTDLESRESAIKSEEIRLDALKKEIVEKIDALQSLQKQLTTGLEADKEEIVKKLKNLAKVYEAAPPAKAGSMLEKLDIKTAAGITMNMKRDKAGIIWGYIDTQKAVEITKEITRTAHALPE
jgi:flagellar motility protein MotE (MotC chaperone)